MAIFQIENGSCIGRGFSDVDATGFCAMFKTWVVKTAVNGGPQWNLLLDRSALPTPVSISSIDVANEIFTSVGHGFYSGEAVIYTASGTAISGLSSGSTYYIRKLSNDTLDLFTNYIGATSTGVGSPVGISGTLPSGTHTFTLCGPYIVVAQTVPATVNSVSKIMKIGYFTSESALVRISNHLSWDDTNKVLRGLYSGFKIATADSASFAYDFRGGDECMFVSTRISTSYSWVLVDEWEGITKLVESPSVTGTVQSGITAGSNVVVQLGTGEASLFTVGNYYYIYDFNNKNTVNYVKISSKNNEADTITLTALLYNMDAGAVIGSYPHRYYVYSNANVQAQGFCYYTMAIPYVSSYNYEFYNISFISSTIYCSINLRIFPINLMSPNDMGLYACMKPVIEESTRHAYGPDSSGMNRSYGKTKNLYFSYGTMAQMLDYRTINSKNYLKIDNSTSINVLLLHSTSVS